MISVDEALRLLADNTESLPVETIGAGDAFGRVLAEEVRADRDFPPTDRSAMDGFAVRSADATTAGAVLRVLGELPSGHAANEARVEPGTAVRIFTGAVIPRGADAVVMVEHTEEDRASGKVQLRRVVEAGQHIRPRAQDLRQDEIVLEPGQWIRAAELAALASVGRTRFDVHRKPLVHVLSTGDELVPPDRSPLPHQIRNSNAPTLSGQLREMGLEAVDLGIAGDELEQLRGKIEQGLEGHLLLITGGVSVGEYDLVGRSLLDAGMELLFHRVAIKPGKPILAGRSKECLVVGLPGNPVSVYCGFAVFVAPVLRRLLGLCRWRNAHLQARLASDIRQRPGRRTYRLARLDVGAEGLEAHPVRSSGSGDVLCLVRGDGFVVVPESISELPAGSTVEVLVWPALSPRE